MFKIIYFRIKQKLNYSSYEKFTTQSTVSC
jgi:hypothetical protein